GRVVFAEPKLNLFHLLNTQVICRAGGSARFFEAGPAGVGKDADPLLFFTHISLPVSELYDIDNMGMTLIYSYCKDKPNIKKPARFSRRLKFSFIHLQLWDNKCCIMA